MRSILPPQGDGQYGVDKVFHGLDLALVKGDVLLLGALQLFGGHSRPPQEHPGHGHVAADLHEGIGVGEGLHDLLGGGLGPDVHGYLAQLVHRLLHLLGGIGNPGDLLGLGDGLLHLAHEVHDGLALLHAQLAAEEIHGLDPVGPFVDGGDAAVTQQLFLGIVAGVPEPAVDLDAHVADVNRLVRAVGLADGDEHLDDILVLFLFLLGLGQVLHVLAEVGIIDQAAHAVHIDLHVEQHAPDVGMLDDGHRRGALVRQVHQVPALDPLPGVVHRVHVGGGGQGQTLHAHEQAGLVHHEEHLAHALVFLAQEQPLALALFPEIHSAGGAAVDAHLLLGAGADDVVEIAHAPVLVDPVLGHDKEGDAGSARGCALDAGQHGMDDVFRHVLVPAGDEDLLPGEAVGPVSVGLGLCGDGAQV